ncbi:hypothetical protein SASPL_100949 [Salvia splendens]|uniref:Uncharacterized protein n=1 Tax=Salvia splendens TaxID=180675 RepID=A0A8X9AAS2_SALSN|nr:hypothetical protein SASPL_100949 [Salvia splendens]
MAMILNLSSIIPAKLTKRRHVVKCESRKLEVGSPIIVIQAPKLLKTASSVPCLRANAGLVNPGDVGREEYLVTYFFTIQIMPAADGSAVQLRRPSAPPIQTPKMRSNCLPLHVSAHSRTILAELGEGQCGGEDRRLAVGEGEIVLEMEVGAWIVSRKPMDVWAVRLSIGTYLIDGKYFKPLELDD